ncbi:MAG: hypothetical protein IRZ11_03850 [Clostridia bacterium]|nr:hypothetical protein [Clostridia bacterium]
MTDAPDLVRVHLDDWEREVLEGEGSRFLLFSDGSDVAEVLHDVLAEACQRHDGIAGFVADGEEFAAVRRRYEEGRHIVDTFHLDELPVIALFRKGRLVTTFEPWIHYAGRRFWRRDLAGQFEVFLEKMVYYDPTKVSDQKNLKLELP